MTPKAVLLPRLLSALVLLGCGGRIAESTQAEPQSLCDLPGADRAKLPIRLAEFGVSDAMAVSRHGVYLAQSAGDARLVRVPRLGGAPVTLGQELFYVKIRSDGDETYVIARGFAGGGSKLLHATADDRLSTLDADLKGADDLLVTPSRLYVADSYTNVLYGYDRDGGRRTVIAENASGVLFASDGTDVYYLGTTELGAGLFRLREDDSSELVWGGLLGGPHRLLFSEGLLYAAGGGIRAFDLGASIVTSVAEASGGIEEFVRLGKDFYFTAGNNSGGGLYRVPVTGGTPELLDSDLGWGGLATDGSAVYYDGGDVALVHCPEPEDA